MEELQAMVATLAAPFIMIAVAAAGFAQLAKMILEGFFDDPKTKTVERPRFHKAVIAAVSMFSGALLAFIYEPTEIMVVTGFAAGTVSGLILAHVKKKIRGAK